MRGRFFPGLWTATTILGWVGLASVVTLTQPDMATNQILFFGLLFFTTFSSAGLAAYGLSYQLFTWRRFQGDVARACWQGLPVGLFITIVAWLQSLRLLSWSLGGTLLGLLVVLEFLAWPKGASEVSKHLTHEEDRD